MPDGKVGLAQEVAVVVGATGEIGSVVVARLISAGLDIIAVGRDRPKLDELAELHQGRVTGCATDIASDSSIDDIRNILDRPVAMVVHAAGVPVAGGVLAADTEAVVQACNVKIGGFMRLCRAVDARLRSKSRLVAIGGHYGFEPSPYAATAGVGNAGLANLVRQLSWAYGPRGVTAHLLAPGPADTMRLQRVASHRAAQVGTDLETELAGIRSESAIGALTTPDQVAWAVRLLLDPEADALAGSAMMLDAGRRRGLP